MNTKFFAMPKTGSGILAHKLGKAGVDYIGHCSFVNAHREMNECSGSGGTVFCFSRHPISRFISAYKFIRDGGIGTGVDVGMTKIVNSYDSFNDFCIDIDNATTNEYAVHFYPQSQWISSDTVVYKYENLIDDIEDAGKRFGFKVGFDDAPNTLNLTARKPDYNRFSPEALESVLEYYKEDFERFGYTR